MSLAIAMAVPALHAQPGDAAQAPVAISIQAQPLAEALNEWARQTRMQIVVQQGLVAGKTAPAVSGQLMPRQALDRVLAGSGLVGVAEGGAIAIRAASTRPDASLAPVTVTAQQERSGVTEHTGSYATRNSSTATKLDLSPRETPQTLSVVTRQKLDDFALDNVEEALESTSAIYILRQGGDGAWYYSRDFRLQSQYDGIPNPMGIGEDNFGPSPDSAFLDRVEILQGASGLMSGAGDPGGTINLVRKRPTEQFQAHVETQLGSWNKRRLVGDISGPLTESGKVRGRAVAFVDRSDSFTDYIFDNRQGFYGIVEADLTESTLLGASVSYQKNKFNNHYGVPMAPDGSDLGLPRSSFFGVSNGDSTREMLSYTLSLDQRLPKDWRLRAAYTRGEVEVDNVSSYIAGTLNLATGDGLRIAAALQERETESDVFDLYTNGPVNLFGRRHELVFGAQTSELKYRNRLGGYHSTNFNLYNFDRSTVTRPPGNFPAWPVHDTTEQQALYGAARFNLSDSLKWLLGTRVSWYEFNARGVLDQKEESVVTPYTGLIYDLNQNYSVYASYSDIFKPQSNMTAGGGRVDPVVGKNYELGVKGEFMDGRLNAAAALFRLEQTNLAEVDPSVPFDAGNVCGGLCYTASGLVVSRGIDLSLNGALSPYWQIGAGYTYVDSEYGSGDLRGENYQSFTPDHILRLFTTYRIPGSAWTVGGNVRLQSKIYTRTTNFFIQQKAYAVVGLMAKYQISKQAELGLTVNNLFDRRYYDSVGSYSTKLENIYGAPRNFAVSLKYAF